MEILQHLLNQTSLQLPSVNLGKLAGKLYVSTGGAPRLLLYSIRCLHHLTLTNSLTDLSLEDKMDDAMDLVYEKLCLVAIVTSVLFIAKTEQKDLQRAWLRLLVYAELGVELKSESEMQLSSTEKISVSQLLRVLNVCIHHT